MRPSFCVCAPWCAFMKELGVYMAKLRLDKYLADAGLGTRSEVKQMIRKGRIVVDGNICKQADAKIDTDTMLVCADGKGVSYAEVSYYMLHKPAGVVSATTDARDKTVLELINEEKRRDLFPVGRLDKDTEGLLLITNDGKLANRLLAPGKHVDKAYYAKINGLVTEQMVKKFAEGVDIGDEKPTLPAALTILHAGEAESEIEIVITEGRYHQIKRMFEAVGLSVTYLKRLRMGKLILDDNLSCGEYRKLTQQEIDALTE